MEPQAASCLRWSRGWPGRFGWFGGKPVEFGTLAGLPGVSRHHPRWNGRVPLLIESRDFDRIVVIRSSMQSDPKRKKDQEVLLTCWRALDGCSLLARERVLRRPSMELKRTEH